MRGLTPILRTLALAPIVGLALAAFDGVATAGDDDRMLVITLDGRASAEIARHGGSGVATYREAGTYTVVWRVPRSQLAPGRSFASSSVVVTGTTSAVLAGSSCRGSLTAGGAPVVLTMTGDEAFRTSPNPFATAASSACPEGLTAGRWRLRAPGPGASRQEQLRDAAHEKAWRVYDDPGFGFTGPSFTPGPKGGNSEGFGLGLGPGGSFTWVAVLTVRGPTNA
jgi:hypothetical protein